MGAMFGWKDLQAGKVVRIKGRPCEIVHADPMKLEWELQVMTTGEKFSLTRRQVYEHQHLCEIVMDHQWQALAPAVRELLASDRNLFTDRQLERAAFKEAVCSYLDKPELGPKLRRKEEHIEAAIKHAMEKDKSGQPKPQVQTVRRLWDPIWIASGKQKKALIDRDHKKGRRRKDDDPYKPVIDLAEKLIDDEIVNNLDEVNTLGGVQELLNDAVWKLHDAGKIQIDPRVDTENDIYVGQNLVRRLFRKRNAHQQLTYDRGRREADRYTTGIGQGPRVEGPLSRAEFDHTPTDYFLLVDDNGDAKVPWLSLIKDKWSGVACGYYISFDRPSWFAVHEDCPCDTPLRLGSQRIGLDYRWPCVLTIRGFHRGFSRPRIPAGEMSLPRALLHCQAKVSYASRTHRAVGRRRGGRSLF